MFFDIKMNIDLYGFGQNMMFAATSWFAQAKAEI